MKIFIPLLFIVSFVSCSFLSPPENYDILKGEHCYIICDSDFYSDEAYGKILLLADESFAAIRKITGIDIQFPIPIYFNDVNINNDLGLASGNGIYLNNDFIFIDEDSQLKVLKHEMVHIFFALYYGHTSSFLFSEGVAEYFSHQISGPVESSSLREHLFKWIDFSYFDYGLNREDYDGISNDLYLLSHEFIYFWCQTYGETSIYELYPEISSANIIGKLEKYSNDSFDNINLRFLEFLGDYW